MTVILSGWQQYPAIQKQQVHSFNFYGFKANHKLTGADIVSLAEMTVRINWNYFYHVGTADIYSSVCCMYKCYHQQCQIFSLRKKNIILITIRRLTWTQLILLISPTWHEYSSRFNVRFKPSAFISSNKMSTRFPWNDTSQVFI